MARPFLPLVLLAIIASNAGLAEAAWWDWHGWRHVFRGRYRRAPPQLSSILTEKLYGAMFLHKDDAACPAKGFYSYAAFLRAAARFPGFGASAGHDDADTRRREVAAFLAQISQESTGGWATAPDGPYSWGLCFKEELNPPSSYCDAAAATNTQWACAANKSYHGRGPMQLSWNYNYGPAGEALGFDGLGSPETVAEDPVVAFETALWFWMTPRPPKPSCHDVMAGLYVPDERDAAANRTAGFGLTTNIINGGIECNGGDARADGRVGFYRRYGRILGVRDLGPNLDCAHQLPY